MSWLVSMVVMSAIGSTLVVKILKVLFGDILGPLATSAQVGTWTAITTGLGLRGVQKTARKLRPSQKEVSTHIKNPLKRKRPK